MLASSVRRRSASSRKSSLLSQKKGLRGGGRAVSILPPVRLYRHQRFALQPAHLAFWPGFGGYGGVADTEEVSPKEKQRQLAGKHSAEFILRFNS